MEWQIQRNNDKFQMEKSYWIISSEQLTEIALEMKLSPSFEILLFRILRKIKSDPTR